MTTTLYTPLVALAIAGVLRYPTDPPTAHPSANPPQPGVSSTSNPPSAKPEEAPTLHLLTNGRILEGRLIQEGDFYVIQQKIGPVPIQQSEWLGSFRSIEEIYQFRLKELPVRDPDEHLKLAKWCVSHRLNDHAKDHLLAVAKLQPGHPEAARMAANIEANETREQLATNRTESNSNSSLDPNVMAASMDRETPIARLDRNDARVAALQEARNRYSGRRGPPVIFDLPPSAAIKRAQEFAAYAHPVLQKRCASCHNERHQGDFQLIQAVRHQDLNEQVILFNMDATLRWIDPTNPLRSQLLVSALFPHKPNNKPIFPGQNDGDYRILATWAKSLQSRANANPNAARNMLAPNSSDTVTATDELIHNAPRFNNNNESVAPVERFASDRISPTVGPPVARQPDSFEDLDYPPPSFQEPAELPTFRTGAGGANDLKNIAELQSRMKPGFGANQGVIANPQFSPESIRMPGSMIPGSQTGLPPIPTGDPELELSPLHGGDMSQLRRPAQTAVPIPIPPPNAAPAAPGLEKSGTVPPAQDAEKPVKPASSKPKVKINSQTLDGFLRSGS